jgi:hypothetical protein
MSDKLIPYREADLVTKLQQAAGVITLQYAQYLVPQTFATDFQERVDLFVARYQTASSLETRSPAAISSKNVAKKAAIESYRWLNNTLQNNSELSDAQLMAVGCPVHKKHREPAKPIHQAPVVEGLTMEGHRMKYRVRSDSSLHAMAAGAKGLAVFSYVGPTEPTADQMKFEGLASDEVIIDFDPSLPIETKVWTSCYWFNNRKVSSPACLPVAAYVNRASAVILPPIMSIAA